MKEQNNYKGNILFFTSFNERSIHMESSVLYFKKKGYRVFFLTTCNKGQIHIELTKNGVFSDELPMNNRTGIVYYFGAVKCFIQFCKIHKIDFVYSHLQGPNFISSIARFFLNSIVFNVRHNSDVIELDGSKKEILMEKVINKMSSHIIAISNKVKDQLINKEGVNSTKIYRINNGYDFGRYNELSVDISESERIRNKYKSKVLIVSPGRLIKTKRHKLSIEGVKELVKIGIDAKLLILGEGPEKEDITKFIVENAVEENVFQLGYIENISDYLMASDIVVLLSNSEASSNIVKEAAYYEKPVIVCENVGDFSDYIVNGESGSLVSKDSPKNEFISIISDFSADNSKYTTMAKELKRTVLNEFSIEEVGKKYEELQSKLVRK